MTRRIIINAAALLGGCAIGALATVIWVAEFI